MIISLHDIKLFPCLIKYQATICFGGAEGQGIHDPFIKLNTGSSTQCQGPIFTPGKKALILTPTDKRMVYHITNLRCHMAPKADDFKMVIGLKIICEPSIHNVRPVRCNTLIGRRNCIYIRNFIWIILGEGH